MRDTEITWHPHTVTREDREQRRGHPGCVIWFTGLSGCGKSTVANLVDGRLYELGASSFVLDGDNIRHGLNASPSMLTDEYGEDFARRFGLGFSAQDRQENIRRIGAVAELFAAAGIIALTAFVSPYRRDRDAVRRRLESGVGTGSFIEVFVDAPLDVCESRDPKGLYQKARAGELTGFTGIDDPYESPLTPELVLRSGTQPPPALAQQVIEFLMTAGKLARLSTSSDKHPPPPL